MYPQKYARALRAVKFSDQNTLNAFGMTTADWIGSQHPHADHTKRLAFADAYQEHTGDEEGARLLHNPEQVVHWDGSRLRPGVVRVQNLAGSRDARGWIGTLLTREGPESVANYVSEGYSPDGGLHEPVWELGNPGNNGNAAHLFGDRRLLVTPEGSSPLYQVQKIHVLPEENAHHDGINSNGETYNFMERLNTHYM